MKALVYTGTEASEIRDMPEPEPQDGEAVVAVHLCGICGSDMHAWHGLDARRVPPMILGHEAVGHVIEGPIGEGRVAINPLMSCGKCRVCQEGREHLCPERRLIGMARPGAFAERVAVAAVNLFALPDDLPDERAVLAEPLACAVHAVRVGEERAVVPPRSAVVLGGGAIGLLSGLVLRARGHQNVRIAEPNPGRREALSVLFGEDAYDPLAGGPDEADLVIDAVGSGATRAAASALAAPGGTIVHIGLQDGAPGLDSRRLTLQEISFTGTYCYTRADFAEAIDLLAADTIDTTGWIETRALDKGAQGFRDIHEGRAPAKIVLAMT